MMKRRLILVGFALLVALSSALVAFGQSEKVVKPKGYASVDGVRPGDKFKVAVALEVAEGYHINAHVPSEDYLIATSVKLDPPSGIHISEERYPAPKNEKFEFSPDKELAVHEGTVIVTADAEADKSIKPGATRISASITGQSCNNKECLAPSD